MLLTQVVVPAEINRLEGLVPSQRIRGSLVCQVASSLNNADAHRSGMEFMLRRGAPCLQHQMQRAVFCTDDDAALASGVCLAASGLTLGQAAQLLADSCRAATVAATTRQQAMSVPQGSSGQQGG
jgi:hypothetical protein